MKYAHLVANRVALDHVIYTANTESVRKLLMRSEIIDETRGESTLFPCDEEMRNDVTKVDFPLRICVSFT